VGWPLFVLRQTYDIIGSWWLLAEDDGVPWGHALSAFQGDDQSVAWILGLAVHADRRGRGCGQALLSSSIDLLGGHGADVVRLAVKPDNAHARRLYDKLGFVDRGEVVEDYFGPGQDRVILTLPLS
jgi:[ribosomal protein S18]-alanine N-acetyltransferase